MQRSRHCIISSNEQMKDYRIKPKPEKNASKDCITEKILKAFSDETVTKFFHQIWDKEKPPKMGIWYQNQNTKEM